MNLYSVYDRVAQMYGPLFEARNDGTAARSVRALYAKIEPHDRDAFVLRRLGWYDQETGLINTDDIIDVEVEIPRFDDVSHRRFAFEELGEQPTGVPVEEV